MSHRSLTSGSSFVPKANSAPDLLVVEACFQNQEAVALSVDADLKLDLHKPGEPTVIATFGFNTSPAIERTQYATGSYYFIRLDSATLALFDSRGIEAKWFAHVGGEHFDEFPVVQQYNFPQLSETILSALEIKDWIRSRLGFPLVDVELTESQLANAIDKALEAYNRYIPKSRFGEIQLIAGQVEYTVPDYGRGVIDLQWVRKEGTPLISDPLFGREYPRGQQLDADQYWLGDSFFETLLRTTGQDLEWRWDPANPDKVYIQSQAQSYLVSYEYLSDHRLEEVTPAHFTLFRKLCLGTAKGTLGEIREKYPTVPTGDGGNLDLNGAALKEQSTKMLEEAEEDLKKLQMVVPPLHY